MVILVDKYKSRVLNKNTAFLCIEHGEKLLMS